MFKMSDVRVPGGVLSFEVETLEELFQRASLIQSMPSVCPIDGSDTCLNYMEIEDNPYYSVRSITNPQYSYKYGRKKQGGALFPKGWYEYDPVAKCQWFWRDGKWYAVDKDDSSPLFDKLRPMAKQPSSPQAANGKQSHTEQRAIADGAALVAMVDEALGGEGMAQDGPEMFDEPSDLAKKRLGMITGAQSGTLHALGGVGGKLKWDEKRPGLCKWASQDRTDSSSQLTQAEAKKLIEFLESALRQRFDTLAMECLEAGIKIDEVDPDAMFGVELANAYKAAQKLRQGQRVTA